MAFVYIIREVGTRWVKVGKAKNVARRVLELETGNPRPLIEIARFDVTDDDVFYAENHIRRAMWPCVSKASGEWLKIRDGSDPLQHAEDKYNELRDLRHIGVPRIRMRAEGDQ